MKGHLSTELISGYIGLTLHLMEKSIFNDVNVIIGIVGIVVTILLFLIPYFLGAFKKPRLEITMQRGRLLRTPEGIMPRNDVVADGYIDRRQALRLMKLQWNISIVIRNHSDVTAYKPKLSFIKGGFEIGAIPQKPITNADEIALIGSYTSIVTEADDFITNFDEEFERIFNRLKLVVEFRNNFGTTYYTRYTYSDKVNKITWLKPKGFKGV